MPGLSPSFDPSPEYFINGNEFIGLQVGTLVSVTLGAKFTVIYEDGEVDVLTVPETAFTNGVTSVTSDHPAKRPGRVISGFVYTAAGSTTPPVGATYANIFCLAGGDVPIQAVNIRARIGGGYIGNLRGGSLGDYQPLNDYATYVFTGTVLEDGTAGTHITSLKITPGAGTEMFLDYGRILVGATATAQTPQAFVTDDGARNVGDLLNANTVSDTVTGKALSLPSVATSTAIGSTSEEQFTAVPARFSGTMVLVLQNTTTAVSITITFAVVCRIRGQALPTATLADTVGTPTLTTNTNKVF